MVPGEITVALELFEASPSLLRLLMLLLLMLLLMLLLLMLLLLMLLLLMLSSRVGNCLVTDKVL